MKSIPLAELLKEKRLAAHISQKTVAEKLGYTTAQFISNWERGVSQLSDFILMRHPISSKCTTGAIAT